MVKPDIQDCLENPWKLKHIFTCKKERLKHLYGKYAINKQKSELIVQNFSDYFTVSFIEYITASKKPNCAKLSNYYLSDIIFYFVVLQKLRYSKSIKHSLSALLMGPIQRITRYPLLLSEINGLYNKAKVASEAEGIQLTTNQKKNIFYIQEALKLSLDLATYVNNMMEAGRIMEYPVL